MGDNFINDVIERREFVRWYTEFEKKQGLSSRCQLPFDILQHSYMATCEMIQKPGLFGGSAKDVVLIREWEAVKTLERTFDEMDPGRPAATACKPTKHARASA